jgi:CubicO group peptidase (beta-lactamase class C family)
MKGLILYLVFSLALLPVTVDAQAPRDASARTEALRMVDAWLSSVQAYHHVPAISAGVVVGDDLVWAKGFGTIDAAHTVPASPQTIYSICSISKLFTSVSFMTLYEAGKVHLDDPVVNYLPWATFKPAEDSGPITLRGLITHSAGIPREAADAPYWSGPDFVFPTREEIRAAVPTQSALYPAERYFQYSNLGLTLIGETVAAVSGQLYADYARTQRHAPGDANGSLRQATRRRIQLHQARRNARPAEAVQRPRPPARRRLHLHRGRPRQVRFMAVPLAAHRPDEYSLRAYPPRDAARPVHGPGLEDQPRPRLPG